MSDSDDLERIRERKLEELRAEEGSETATEEPTESGGTPEEPIHIEGSDHLQETVAEHDVVLADFYADWCGPCQMMEPAIERLATEAEAAVAKVDVDAHQSLAGQYGVRGVPTLVVFAGGEVAERVTGARDYDALASLVGRHA